MRSNARGHDLHQHIGHLVEIDGKSAQLLWADPENNGLLVRIRTAERGREYLVRDEVYPVSDLPLPIADDDATDRWDNEPPFVPTPPAPTHEVVIAPSRPGLLDWRCSCGETSDYDYGSFGRAAEASTVHVPDDEALIITRPSATTGGDAR